MDRVNFKQIQLTNKPNDYLVCPPNYCNVSPREIAPQYPVDVETLQNAWDQLIANQPRVSLVHSDPAQHHFQYVQRTAVFRFPDYIDVEFIPLTDHASTIAIYSRAKYGYSDFHVNEKRVKSWLSQLPQFFPKG